MGFVEDARSPVVVLAGLASLLLGGPTGCGVTSPSPQTRTRVPASSTDQRTAGRLDDEEIEDDEVEDDEVEDDEDAEDGQDVDDDDAKKDDDDADDVTIRWNQPIDSTWFGLAPNPKIDGKTLADIVAGKTAGRDDGKLCSECHNAAEASGGYGLRVAENGAVRALDPWDEVGTTSKESWAGKGGWAERFVANRTKPANVKAVFRAWIRGRFK